MVFVFIVTLVGTILIKGLRNSQARIFPSFQFYKLIMHIMELPKNVPLNFPHVKVKYFASEVNIKVQLEMIISTPNVFLLWRDAKPASLAAFQLLSMKSNMF